MKARSVDGRSSYRQVGRPRLCDHGLFFGFYEYIPSRRLTSQSADTTVSRRGRQQAIFSNILPPNDRHTLNFVLHKVPFPYIKFSGGKIHSSLNDDVINRTKVKYYYYYYGY